VIYFATCRPRSYQQKVDRVRSCLRATSEILIRSIPPRRLLPFNAQVLLLYFPGLPPFICAWLSGSVILAFFKMTVSINVSHATSQAAKDAQVSIITLLCQIKATEDTRGDFTDLLNRLSSLDKVLQRLVPASDANVAMGKLGIEAHLHLVLSNCEMTCDAFEKRLRKFIDRSLNGTACKMNHGRFGLIGGVEVQLLSEQLDQWTIVVSKMVEFSLYVKFTLLTPAIFD
jgi:hypothetical protein